MVFHFSKVQNFVKTKLWHNNWNVHYIINHLNQKTMSKKITLLLVFIGMIGLQSCTVNEDRVVNDNIDYDTISEVFEVTRSFSASNDFSTLVTFPHTIYSSDMVLVYRLDNVINGNTDVWKLLPQTYYFNDGRLDFRYDFNFTMYDAEIYMDGFDLAGISSAYRSNQVFRIVIIPAYFGKGTSTIKYDNYDEVIKKYNIDESKIVKIK